jgi:hypothetical protein
MGHTMSTTFTGCSIEWTKADPKKVPHMINKEVPGLRSLEMQRQAATVIIGTDKAVPACVRKGGRSHATACGRQHICLDFSLGI